MAVLVTTTMLNRCMVVGCDRDPPTKPNRFTIGPLIEKGTICKIKTILSITFSS